MNQAPKNTDQFQALVEVVKALRAPGGCPWDREQTHQTLTQYAIEEAHELADAIDTGKVPLMVEELGDLLLQVILHAEIGRQEGSFSLDDVIRGITEKMIRRHPHVFSDVKVENSAEVMKNWAQIKDAEKNAQDQASGSNIKKLDGNPFASIPQNMPALIRAQKIGSKTVRYHFDWQNPQQVIEKIEEELGELKEAIREKPQIEQQLEMGDLLFTVAQLARHLGFDCEQSLRLTNKKFETRFMKMHEMVQADKKVFADLPIQELESYWQRAKLSLRHPV